MSYQTFIHFFTTGHVEDPVRSIQAVLDMLDPGYIDVTLYDGADQSWLYRDEDYDGPVIEILRERMSREDAVKHWRPDKLLALSCGSPMLAAISAAIKREVPANIYGDTLPQNTYFRIGLHEIYDLSRLDGELFGRATFSVCFWGYRNPPDIAAYSAAVMKLPIIELIEARLTSIWGATQCHVYES